MQLFDSSGHKIGLSYSPPHNAFNQENSHITALSGGGYAVSWDEGAYNLTGDTDGRRVMVQVFDALGNQVGSEIQVNTYTKGDQQYPSIAALKDGGFIVTWQDGSGTLGDSSSSSIKAQIYHIENSVTGHVKVIVQNEAPISSGDHAHIDMVEDVAIHISAADLFKGYSDANGDRLTATDVKVSNGVFLAGVDGGLTVLAGEEFSGNLTITYKVTDASGVSVDASMTIAVEPVNDAPKVLWLSNTDVMRTAAAGSLVGSFEIKDPDDSSGFTLTILNDDSHAFKIVGDKLLVTDSFKLKFWKDAFIPVTVQVTDPHGASLVRTYDLYLHNAGSGFIKANMTAGEAVIQSPVTPPHHLFGELRPGAINVSQSHFSAIGGGHMLTDGAQTWPSEAEHLYPDASLGAGEMAGSGLHMANTACHGVAYSGVVVGDFAFF